MSAVKIAGRVAAAAGVVLIAGGCAASSAPASPQAVMQLLAYHAREASSVSATITMSASGGLLDVTGSAVVQVRPALLADLKFSTFEAGGQSLGTGVEEILTSNAVYMTGISGLQDGKWVEVSLASLSTKSGVDFGQLLQQAQNENPLQQAQLLAGSSDAHKAGTGTLDGVTVTEYTGTYSMAKAIATLPASDRGSVQKELAQEGITTASFQVWVDGQDQVRKLIVTTNGRVSVTITMNVTSYNQPVQVPLPAPQDVTEISGAALNGG